MYPLGDNFKIKTNSIPNESNVIKGKYYRITLLSLNLVRLEYSPSGEFLDAPTQLAWNRNFGPVNFNKREDNNYLEISTPYFKINYSKEKSFVGGKFTPDANLKVNILGSNTIWYYGNPEVKNLKTSDNELRNGSLKEQGLYSLDGYATIDDSNSKVLDSDGNFIDRSFKEIDIYLFVYNKDFTLCLKNFYALTGNPPLIPRYALGNWWSKTVSYNELDIKNLIDKFKSKRIPLSVLLLDTDWHKRIGNLETGFTFNNNLFPSPSALTNYLHSEKIELGLAVSPTEGFTQVDDIYKESSKYVESTKDGFIPFNVLNPRWVDVYLKMYIHPLDKLGVNFYWLKNNNKISNKERFLLNHYQTYDMLRNFDNRPLILSSYTGICDHRYPILYSGKQSVSWETLSAIPKHNFSATNKGISWWAHDIGGYYKGIEESELFIRFVQLGVFSPILKFGSAECKYYKREPWKWDIKTYSIVKEYLTLRHQLVPYLYSLAFELYKNSQPLIKPLYYTDEFVIDDDRYRNEYYLGNELLVCPILKKKDLVMERTVSQMFIPAGTWYDFVTGKKFPGNKSYVSFVREQDYPVFARAGSIIPMGLNENMNDLTPPKDMEIHIFPGCSNSFKLYEDDGTTNLYLKGHYLLTVIDYKYESNGYVLTLKALEGKSGIVPDKRNYKFRFRNTKSSNKITVTHNGESYAFTTYVDGNDFIVEVKDVNTTGQLQIKCLEPKFEIEATRIINGEIDDILNDVLIETELKQKLANILFSDLPIKKKRIEVRKLKGLEKKFEKLFLKLLEYIEQV